MMHKSALEVIQIIDYCKLHLKPNNLTSWLKDNRTFEKNSGIWFTSLDLTPNTEYNIQLNNGTVYTFKS